MTVVLIGVVVWLLLVAVAWALAQAIGRADAREGPLDEHDLLYAPPSRNGAGQRTVVADLAVLRMRLGAAGILLRSPCVSVVLVGADGEHEIASAGSPLRPDATQQIAAPIGSRVLVVATRTERDEVFDDADRRLLASTAATLGDVLAIPDEERRTRTGRFARRASEVARRRRS